MGAYEWALLVVIGMCALLLLLNWASLLQAVVRKQGVSFMPPWICGLLASVALWLYPQAAVSRWWWLALLLDPSISVVLLLLLWQSVAGKNRD